MVVSEVISDEEVKTSSDCPDFEGEAAYKIIPKLDFSEMFEEVWSSLNKG